ncbi:MAG: toxin-antitoxin system YwqK family antitoxin [Candidatus Omnitrophica bacterium]|nr:toxin-antitoxin system YwqK family antitoxin [Candidatus Omnitrophota bacterium]
MFKKIIIICLSVIFCAGVCCGQEQTQEEYYPSGVLKTEISFKDGKIHGMLKKYYENGGLRSVVPYKQGLRHGIVQGYYESGELAVEVSYADDERQGDTVYYDKQGNILGEESWGNMAGILNEILFDAVNR